MINLKNPCNSSKTHQNTLDCLENRVERLHDYVVREYEYTGGELDLYSVEGDRALLFEVKSSCHNKSVIKAQQQLERGAKHLKMKYGVSEVYRFIVFPDEIYYMGRI